MIGEYGPWPKNLELIGCTNLNNLLGYLGLQTLFLTALATNNFYSGSV